MNEIIVSTSRRAELVDITARVVAVIAAAGRRQGSCCLFVPHTTAGITVNENWDPDVRHDILWALDQIVPESGAYRHGEGNSAAHVKALLTGSSLCIPIEAGALALGTWQGLYLAEFDGPRQRRVLIQLHPADCPDASSAAR